jgi:large subunit ribosomal protein L18
MTTNLQQLKRNKRLLRHGRVRSRVTGEESRPRMAVFRSSSHIYVQLINDKSGTTIAQASSRDVKEKSAKTDLSSAVGKLIASKAKEKGITKVVFDRGGYRYHGRVKALAEGAREGGLEF